MDLLKELPGTMRKPELSLESVEHDAILKEYNTIIKEAPDFIYAYYNRAEIYILEKDYRAAITDYTKAINLEPASRRLTSIGESPACQLAKHAMGWMTCVRRANWESYSRIASSSGCSNGRFRGNILKRFKTV